jgi:photosystem II stability/assembly factor-like uncharacterized protein
MRLTVALLLAGVMEAQTPSAGPELAESPKTEIKSPVVLRNEGKPMGILFGCTDDDMQWAGMSCSEEEPCPVYLELSGIDTVGNRIIVLGNIHTESLTLYSLLVSSEDGGATWQEPYERMRGAGLNHIQLIDFQNGWISGETVVPVARDAFFLITSDGGKSWRMRPVLAEGMGGAIRQFHFESASSGTMVIDRMQSAESSRYELYDTPNGGETWMIRRTSDQPITLPHPAPDPASSGWRIRADSHSKSFAIEKLQGEKWGTVASFLVQIGACKPAPHVMPPPPETASETPAAPESPPSLSKPRRKP